MSKPTKNEYLMALNGIKSINEVINIHRKNIDKYLDCIIEIKSSINGLEEVKKRNEEIVMRYKLYEEKERGIDE